MDKCVYTDRKTTLWRYHCVLLTMMRAFTKHTFLYCWCNELCSFMGPSRKEALSGSSHKEPHCLVSYSILGWLDSELWPSNQFGSFLLLKLNIRFYHLIQKQTVRVHENCLDYDHSSPRFNHVLMSRILTHPSDAAGDLWSVPVSKKMLRLIHETSLPIFYLPASLLSIKTTKTKQEKRKRKNERKRENECFPWCWISSSDPSLVDNLK